MYTTNALYVSDEMGIIFHYHKGNILSHYSPHLTFILQQSIYTHIKKNISHLPLPSKQWSSNMGWIWVESMLHQLKFDLNSTFIACWVVMHRDLGSSPLRFLSISLYQIVWFVDIIYQMDSVDNRLNNIISWQNQTQSISSQNENFTVGFLTICPQNIAVF